MPPPPPQGVKRKAGQIDPEPVIPVSKKRVKKYSHGQLQVLFKQVFRNILV
jgi:hypothetical protein